MKVKTLSFSGAATLCEVSSPPSLSLGNTGGLGDGSALRSAVPEFREAFLSL